MELQVYATLQNWPTASPLSEQQTGCLLSGETEPEEGTQGLGIPGTDGRWVVTLISGNTSKVHILNGNNLTQLLPLPSEKIG